MKELKGAGQELQAEQERQQKHEQAKKNLEAQLRDLEVCIETTKQQIDIKQKKVTDTSGVDTVIQILSEISAENITDLEDSQIGDTEF